MKVSLIITTYNNHIVLKKVMESILHQTRCPDELFVADDGSDERTASVVNLYAKEAPFPVLHVWQENRGFRAAKTRNEAIKQAAGDYIVLLDGDCVVNKHFIADHLFLAEESCFIQGKRVHVEKNTVASFTYEHANSFPRLIEMSVKGRISNIHHVIRLPFDFSVKNRSLKGIKACNMSFFRKDIAAVNGFNEDFVGWGNEDSELACRFFRYGLKKKVHPFMAICFHLWHPSNKGEAKGNKELLDATLQSKEFFCANGLVKDAPGSGERKARSGGYSREPARYARKVRYPGARL
jgi:glycosyltransferase involved in cell wall biosynthesis